MKGQAGRVVADDEHRLLRSVPPGCGAVEIDEGDLELHGSPQADVVPVMGVGSPIAVAEEAVSAHLVLVGPLAALDDGDRRDAQRDLRQDRWLEDALGTHQRYSVARPAESLL